MNNYLDKYGRYHHKPCINGEPSSNNGWLYSAYAAKTGIVLGKQALSMSYDQCKRRNEQSQYLNRHPHKESVPFSRDEYLGVVALGLLNEPLNNWSFSPFPLPKFSLVELAKQLWQLRPEILHNPYAIQLRHRNYFWQNNLDQLYRFAFSVPVQDRHFILKSWGKFQWYRPSHMFYAAVSFIDSKLPKKSGIKWLKYGGEGNLREMVKEFPVGHPIEKVVNGAL